MDPWVIDVPFLARWFLVNALILPRRPKKSAEAYRKVWTERGSPLRFHLNDLVEQVQRGLGSAWVVKPGMRYGQPSILKALEEFRAEGIRDLVIFPLYPQYSTAATESSVVECRRLAGKVFPEARLEFVPPFFADAGFIRSFAEVIRASLVEYPYDHLLFSFHGLPERQIRKLDPTGSHCLSKPDCCEVSVAANSQCYRAQCYTTARLIAQELGLTADRYTVCFQSRLGRTPWIRPYTDELYESLAKRGVKKLAVACPAFVADCLETLEEVQMRGREQFLANGGEELRLVPSLNSEPLWVEAVQKMVPAIA